MLFCRLSFTSASFALADWSKQPVWDVCRSVQSLCLHLLFLWIQLDIGTYGAHCPVRVKTGNNCWKAEKLAENQSILTINLWNSNQKSIMNERSHTEPEVNQISTNFDAELESIYSLPDNNCVCHKNDNNKWRTAN